MKDLEPINMCLGKFDLDKTVRFDTNQTIEFNVNVTSFMEEHKRQMVGIEINPCSLSLDVTHAYSDGILTVKLLNTGKAMKIPRGQTLFIYRIYIY